MAPSKLAPASTMLSALLLLLLLLLAVVPSPVAADITIPIPGPIESMLPHTPVNGTIQEEIKCYSLPYGGIGFASHVLTYWTLLWLNFNRSPIRPWRPLCSWKLDLSLGAASLLTTVLLSGLAIVRCSGSWPFVLVAVWKMMLSLVLGGTSVHRAIDVRRRFKREKMKAEGWIPGGGATGKLGAAPWSPLSSPSPSPSPYLASPGYELGSPYQQQQQQPFLNAPPNSYFGYQPPVRTRTFAGNSYESLSAPSNASTPALLGRKGRPPPPPPSRRHSTAPTLWLLLYGAGVIVGLTGLGAILKEAWPERSRAMEIITGAFVGLVGLVIVGCIVAGACAKCFGTGVFIGALTGPAVAAVLAALYSDWILAAIMVQLGQGGWAGVPSRDNQPLYWAYFVAKRFPLFSS